MGEFARETISAPEDKAPSSDTFYFLLGPNGLSSSESSPCTGALALDLASLYLLSGEG